MQEIGKKILEHEIGCFYRTLYLEENVQVNVAGRDSLM